MVKSIQEQFRKKYGEFFYSPYQIERMFLRDDNHQIAPSVVNIKKHARKLKILRGVEEEGINPGKSNLRSLIPESDLEALTKSVKKPLSLGRMIEILTKIGYREKE